MYLWPSLRPMRVRCQSATFADVDALRSWLDGAARLYGRLMADYALGFDVLVAVAVAILGVADSSNASGILGAVVFGAALAVRRRLPVTVYVVVFLSAAVTGRDDSLGTFFALLIAAYTLIVSHLSPWISFAMLLASATYIDLFLGGNLNFIPDLAAPFIIMGGLWIAGTAVRTRQRRADASESRAARLEREQGHARQIAVVAERARIARELHDVVAHNVSVMVVQAGAARRKLKRSPMAAISALLAVEATGREALQELRDFLGVLDPGNDSVAMLAPQPGTADVEALLRRVADAGLPVELRVRGERKALPPGLDLAAYRVVQEGLTNALKYAQRAHTEVVLDFRADGIEVEVLDDGPGKAADAPAGRGLSGLRERVALYGGSFEAGRRPSGGFAVRAWLPSTLPQP
jgi:signal transduction histidine kinase